MGNIDSPLVASQETVKLFAAQIPGRQDNVGAAMVLRNSSSDLVKPFKQLGIELQGALDCSPTGFFEDPIPLFRQLLPDPVARTALHDDVALTRYP